MRSQNVLILRLSAIFLLITVSFTIADDWTVGVGTDVRAYEGGTGIAGNTNEATQPLSLKVYPNPFSHTKNIGYSILDTRYLIQEQTIVIYDAAGRIIRHFDPVSSIQNLESSLVWDGQDDAGRLVPYGVYFVHLRAGDRSISQKVLFIR